MINICSMKSSKEQASVCKKNYYVGIRSSDRVYDNGFFNGDISLFFEGMEDGQYGVRPNQNKIDDTLFSSLVNRTKEMILQDPDSRFFFYNGAMAYRMPVEMHKFFCCINSIELLDFFNSKSNTKRWFANNGIPIVPYETFLGQEITADLLMQRFPHAKKYVVQSDHGGGGIGTFLITRDCLRQGLPFLQPLQQYLISAYIENGVSANTHVFISDDQTVISPGSVQITELDQGQLFYRGADFLAFRGLPEVSREKIRKISTSVAKNLRQRGYRGVAGIDFFVDHGGDVYCMEINPRFQASSILLDLYLSKNTSGDSGARTTFELNEQAFSNHINTSLCFESVIDYSCYYYYKGNSPIENLLKKREVLMEKSVLIHDDGFLNFAKKNRLDKYSYLFRAIFNHAICAISPDMTLWLNDNIPVLETPKDLIDLKIALLNQGVRLSDHCAQPKKAVYESIDISFRGEKYAKSPIAMNCAYQINLSQYSPFLLEESGQGGNLTYYGKSIGQVKIESDRLIDMPYTDRRILYLATDRLRIKLVSGCEYKNVGQGCKFCNLPGSDTRFTRDELSAALVRLKRSRISFRHILIGGGTCLSQDVWEDVLWICHFLKEDDYYKDKPISLMSVLPPREMLQRFREAGLEEVAFNIEVSDDVTAQRLMPGKRRQPKDAYYSILKDAVKIFGAGAVRSALLVGIDQENTLLEEVLHLAQMNVIPCLSVLRPLPKTEFTASGHPDNASLRKVYEKCTNALAKMNGEITALGPKCRECRNNMLAI